MRSAYCGAGANSVGTGIVSKLAIKKNNNNIKFRIKRKSMF